MLPFMVAIYMTGEKKMTFQEIEFALKVNGVEQEDVQTLITYCKTKGTDYQKLDEMLMEMGYDKVFTDEFFGWVESENEDGDEEYFYSEKIYHRYGREDEDDL